MFILKTLQERLKHIQGRVNNAAIKAGRNPKQITIIAITKKFPLEIWEQALSAKLTIFGESQVREAAEKAEKFSKREKIKVHFIGHLQSNKVRKAIALFDVIQTVDSTRLAKKINKICKEEQKKQSLFLQVNIDGDPKKHGFTAKNAITAAREINKLENLQLDGIMTIPSQKHSIKEIRSIYRKTRELRDKIRKNINDNCKNISMGMTKDYEIAITEGATHIRIGTGLFGSRKK